MDPKPNEQDAPPAGDPQATPASFDTWYATQDDATKAIIEEHTSGLSSALKAEREQRKALSAQLKELSGKAEGETRKALDELNAKLEAEATRANFYEAATAAGVKNLRLAHLAAQADGLISGGSCDFEALKGKHPELFGSAPPAPPAHPGVKRDQSPPAGNGFTNWLKAELKR